MASRHFSTRGSLVRMGMLSILSLVVILCLAVLAVLSFSTARAELAITERQATTATETYQLETAGQEFIAALDGALASQDTAERFRVLASYGIHEVEGEGAVLELALANGIVPVSVSGTCTNDLVNATFSLESGRRLDLAVRIVGRAYTIEQWKVTTQWPDDAAGGGLWLG